FDQQILKELKLNNVDDYFGRKTIADKGVEFDNAGNPISKELRNRYNPEKILGKERIYEFRAQGIQEGEVMYAREAAANGKSWDKLTPQEMKKVKAEATARIIERRARVHAARKYHSFLTYVREQATDDAGNKLAFNINSLAKSNPEELRKLQREG